MDDVVLIKDLPSDLVEAVMKELTAYVVAFIRFGDAAVNPPADLLGSGVLVAVATKRAILTADHVVDVLPASGRIGLFLERTNQPHTIDSAGVSMVRIGRGTDDAVGPDLSAIVLSPSIAASIGAKRSFVNLDKHRTQLLEAPPESNQGAWFCQGFLDERTTVGFDRTEPDFTKYFYNFTGIGGPEGQEHIGEHDYFHLPVDAASTSVAPIRWGGMSGGGVWQVPFKRDGTRIAHLPPLLSGVMFYQHVRSGVCEIRCHGRRSVYEAAFKAIIGEP
jgi:hypothetical protein